ncbi:Squamosa promoter-binding-like protein 16 [Linum grandiflorum]
MESSSLGGSSKRARMPSNGLQPPACLVDGCTSDLTKCREYHRRHKVCEVHSKTARVFVKGQELRFCQQCSRFHSLGEFDDGKRSCRKRLDGHNRRRRKPQPVSLSMNSARLFSDHQAWSTMKTFKPEDDAILYNSGGGGNQSTLNFIGSNIGGGGGKQFPFLQTDPPPGLEPPSHQIFSNGAIPAIKEADRALSLLSSPPPEISLMTTTHLVHHHPHLSSCCYNGVCEPIDGSVMSNGSSSISLHSMFQIGGGSASGGGGGGDDGSSSCSAGSGSHHHSSLSFSWH